jgi:hypothetical protein
MFFDNEESVGEQSISDEITDKVAAKVAEQILDRISAQLGEFLTNIEKIVANGVSAIAGVEVTANQQACVPVEEHGMLSGVIDALQGGLGDVLGQDTPNADLKKPTPTNVPVEESGFSIGF